jgi:hypothetical protein
MRREDSVAGCAVEKESLLTLVQGLPGGRQKRLAGGTAREATSDEVKAIQAQARQLQELLTEVLLENRLLKQQSTVCRAVAPASRLFTGRVNRQQFCNHGVQVGLYPIEPLVEGYLTFLLHSGNRRAVKAGLIGIDDAGLRRRGITGAPDGIAVWPPRRLADSRKSMVAPVE